MQSVTTGLDLDYRTIHLTAIFDSAVRGAPKASPVDFEPNSEWDRFLAQA